MTVRPMFDKGGVVDVVICEVMAGWAARGYFELDALMAHVETCEICAVAMATVAMEFRHDDAGDNQKAAPARKSAGDGCPLAGWLAGGAFDLDVARARAHVLAGGCPVCKDRADVLASQWGVADTFDLADVFDLADDDGAAETDGDGAGAAETDDGRPSAAQLAAWAADGGCEATDGCWVEPDGHCQHGRPSWLLVLGYV